MQLKLIFFSFVVDTAVQAADQASREKKQQLQAELNTIKCLCQDKDQQISSLKEELQTKQEEITSLSDQLAQRENEMLEQKSKENESTR